MTNQIIILLSYHMEYLHYLNWTTINILLFQPPISYLIGSILDFFLFLLHIRILYFLNITFIVLICSAYLKYHPFLIDVSKLENSNENNYNLFSYFSISKKYFIIIISLWVTIIHFFNLILQLFKIFFLLQYYFLTILVLFTYSINYFVLFFVLPVDNLLLY